MPEVVFKELIHLQTPVDPAIIHKERDDWLGHGSGLRQWKRDHEVETAAGRYETEVFPGVVPPCLVSLRRHGASNS